MTYKIKPEFLELWGEDATEETILTEQDVEDIARGWDKTSADVMDQLIPCGCWYAVQRDCEDDWSTGSSSLTKAIQMARTVKDFGYDAAITTAPYYYKFGMKGIAHYLSKIREQADIPLFFYNFPGNTGVEIDLADENIRAVMTDGTISGVKQTSLNLYQLERLRNMNPELVIYGGYDEVYLGARILGADGAIGSTFNFTLPLFTKIEAAYAERRIEDAQALQRRANNIMQALVSCQLFPSIKHILKVRGLDCGDCREPFGRLTEEQKAYVEKVVKENMEA